MHYFAGDHEKKAIIIGAGTNSMATAFYLQTHGIDTLVVEKNSMVGGAAVTHTIDGHRISRFSYLYSLFSPAIRRDMELDRHGLELLSEGRDPTTFTPLLDGQKILLYSDLKKTQQFIAEHFSSRDAENFKVYEEDIARFGKMLLGVMEMEPPTGFFGAKNISKWMKLNHMRVEHGISLREAHRLGSASLYEYLSRYFETDAIIASECANGVVGLYAGPYDPETAFGLVHHATGGVNGKPGAWAQVRGGMGELSESMRRSCEEKGVRFLLNTPVQKIIVDDNHAKGIILENGTDLLCDIVVSGVGPNITYEKLVGREHLPKSFVKKLDNRDYRSATAKVNLVISGQLQFYAHDEPVAGTIHMGADAVQGIQNIFEQAKRGVIPDKPLVEMIRSSLLDKTLTSEGKEVISVLTQYVPAKLEGRNWDKNAKDELFRKVVDTCSQYSNLKDIVEAGEVEVVDVLPPSGIEELTGLKEGNLFQLAMTKKQLLHKRPFSGYTYDSPVVGLYNCGACTHPGGGVLGYNGRNCATRILEDIKK